MTPNFVWVDPVCIIYTILKSWCLPKRVSSISISNVTFLFFLVKANIFDTLVQSRNFNSFLGFYAAAYSIKTFYCEVWLVIFSYSPYFAIELQVLNLQLWLRLPWHFCTMGKCSHGIYDKYNYNVFLLGL